MAQYFFDLGQCLHERKLDRAIMLAKAAPVELMTHPVLTEEREFLLGNQFQAFLAGVPTAGYAAL